MKQGKTGIDNLAKHWLCGLFTALLTILIQRTASAQTFLYTGIATNVTLGRGTYNITAYGAQGGSGFADNTIGGLGAEVAAKFKFTKARTLTLLVAGAGDSASYTTGAGGGGGSFVVNCTTPLIVAGGGGGGSYNGSASNANVGTSGGIGGGSGDGAGGSGGTGGSGGSGAAGGGGGGLKGVGGGDGGIFTGYGGYSFLLGGSGGTGDTYLDDGDHGGGFGGGGGGGAPGGGGGGGYSGGGGGGIGGGGGGGSIINPSAILVLAELPGVASPDDSPNGEIIITPSTSGTFTLSESQKDSVFCSNKTSESCEILTQGKYTAKGVVFVGDTNVLESLGPDAVVTINIGSSTFGGPVNTATMASHQFATFDLTDLDCANTPCKTNVHGTVTFTKATDGLAVSISTKTGTTANEAFEDSVIASAFATNNAAFTGSFDVAVIVNGVFTDSFTVGVSGTASTKATIKNGATFDLNTVKLKSTGISM